MSLPPNSSDPSVKVETPPLRPKPGRPKVGDWNVLEASIGKKGMGKSTHQCQRALELCRQAGGAYVIGHSLGQRLPEVLPDGTKLPIVYHRDLRSLEKGLQRKPESWHILAPPLPEEGGDLEPDSADDLIRFSIRLSAALRKDAYQRAHPLQLFVPKSVRYTGLECPPIIVILDEGIAVDAASSGDRSRGQDKWFLQWIYGLRHLHTAVLYAIQEPTSRSWRVLEASTAIHVFRVKHQWALLAIQACGASREQVDEIRRFPKYSYLTMDDDDLPPSEDRKERFREARKGEPDAAR